MQLACPINYFCGTGNQISAPAPPSKFLLLLQPCQIVSGLAPQSAAYTSLIHISPSCWTIYRSFDIILERELSIGLDFKSKNIQSDMNYALKST